MADAPESALHPAAVLYGGGKPFPALAACEHYAGSEKLIRKALELQHQMGPVFDVTADCEDGAPAGQETAHAEMVARLLRDPANGHRRLGVRIHDITHPHWRRDLDIVLGSAAREVAYVVLPKVRGVADVAEQAAAVTALTRRAGETCDLPLHVLIETPGALHEVWEIAAFPGIESIDFGLMDFVSAHHGAIPGSAMRSPGQFEHPLLVRAKCEIAAAALGCGVVPAHNVTTELRDLAVVSADAERARLSFGFLRMWSIHPAQILPIVEAMRPGGGEIAEAADILAAAQDARWGPIQHQDKLHDRASYRYYWELLQRARATGAELPATARQRFFT